MRPADRAWIALAAGVVAYEAAAGEGELLSEGCDRYLQTHPWVTRIVVYSLALHLCNAIPDRFDPIHQLFLLARRARA